MIEDWIDAAPEPARPALRRIHALFREAAPGAEERISYGIPCFFVGGRVVLYFAGFPKHVSIYPATAGILAALGEELAPHQKGKATIQFKLTEPLPEDLIRRVLAARLAEMAAAPRKRGRKERAGSG